MLSESVTPLLTPLLTPLEGESILKPETRDHFVAEEAGTNSGAAKSQGSLGKG